MLEKEGVPVEVEVLEFKAKYFTLKYTCFIMLFKIYITPFIYYNELIRSYNSYFLIKFQAWCKYLQEIHFHNWKLISVWWKIGGWFFGTLVVAGRVVWNRICLSFCWSGRFLGMVSLVFSKFWHDAGNPYEVVCGRARFSRKNFSQKLGKWTKNGLETEFFEFIQKFCH